MDIRATAATPQQVADLWFDDSGLVIQAGNCLFRVSGALLAARSPVFRDMLSFPQPEGGETCEGCPLVRLPDSEIDATRFFRAVFDSGFFEPYPAPMQFEIIISILHLSDKYHVDYLRRRALVHLSSRYPTALSAYDTDKFRFHASIDWHVSVIQIAREFDATWLLPSAFYLIAAAKDDDIQQVLNTSSYDKRSVRLSSDDQVRFFKSSLQISIAGNTVVESLHSSGAIAACPQLRGCYLVRMRALTAAQAYIQNADPLDLSNTVWPILSKDCCTACVAHFKTTLKAGRQDFWNTLPAICGLPPWEELERMKGRALGE